MSVWGRKPQLKISDLNQHNIMSPRNIYILTMTEQKNH